MKPLDEQHLATLRRHMVEVIDIEFDLVGEEVGVTSLCARHREALITVLRHLLVPH